MACDTIDCDWLGTKENSDYTFASLYSRFKVMMCDLLGARIHPNNSSNFLTIFRRKFESCDVKGVFRR